MPSVTGRIEEVNMTENTGKLPCPHLREKSDETPHIEEKKEKEIKEQATQLDETGTKDGTIVQTGTVNLHFLIPGSSEPITATFSLQDNVQDLRQIVLDRPESCYRTCFSLQIDGVRLDDFAELNMIEGLKDEATIKVVEEPYSVREARIHLRRIKDLLSTNFHVNAYSAIDHLSLSFLSAVAGVDVEEEVLRVKGQNVGTVSTEECLPPTHVFASDEIPCLMEPLFPSNAEPKLRMKDLVSTLILLFTLMSLITFTSGNQPQNGRQFTQREIDAYKRCKSTACVARVSLCIINKDCANCRPIAGKKLYMLRGLLQMPWSESVGLCTHTPRNDKNSTQQISSSYGDLSRSIPTMFDIISQGSHFPIAFMTRGKKGSSNHCKVAFFHRCVAKEDCIVSCGDMGSHRYRWFRNGCCQCVEHRCKDYGELQPLCQMCGIN